MSGPRQLPLDLGHRAAMGERDFLVAPCNKDAVAWIDAWPRWPAPLLVLYGPKGSGKTHLARVWCGKSGAILCPPTVLAQPDLRDLLSRHRGLAIEFDGPAGPAATWEEPLFHLYNLARELGGFLLITAPGAPATWQIGLADLRSRIAAAPSVGIGMPDESLLGAILVKLFADRQIEIDAGVIPFVLARIERSFAAVQALVERLDQTSLAERRRVTVPLARRVLDADTQSGLDFSGSRRG